MIKLNTCEHNKVFKQEIIMEKSCYTGNSHMHINSFVYAMIQVRTQILVQQRLLKISCLIVNPTWHYEFELPHRIGISIGRYKTSSTVRVASRF